MSGNWYHNITIWSTLGTDTEAVNLGAALNAETRGTKQQLTPPIIL